MLATTRVEQLLSRLIAWIASRLTPVWIQVPLISSSRSFSRSFAQAIPSADFRLHLSIDIRVHRLARSTFDLCRFSQPISIEYCNYLWYLKTFLVVSLSAGTDLTVVRQFYTDPLIVCQFSHQYYIDKICSYPVCFSFQFVVIWFDRRRAAAWLRVPCGGWLWTTRRFNYLHQVWTTIAVHTRSLVFGPTSLPALLIVTTIVVHMDSLASCPLSCLYYSSSFTFGTCDWFSFWHQQSCSGVCLETIQCGRSYWSECASHRRASGLAHKTATPSVSLEERAHYGVEFLEYWAEYRR